MSMGLGTFAEVYLEDNEMIIYRYGSYNLNDERYENNERVMDGTIFIRKEGLVEPEIREKIKKLPNGLKKVLIKRYPKEVDYDNLIRKGLIIVDNCSNCWRKTDTEESIDVMAMRIICRVFDEYQKNGESHKSIHMAW